MTLVNIGGRNFDITPEAWPPIDGMGTIARSTTQLSSSEISDLEAKDGFGRADWSGNRDAYADHAGTQAYGLANPVLMGAACWNLALTGATNFDSDTMLNPSQLFDLCNNITEFEMTREFCLAPATEGRDTAVALRAFEANHTAAVTALINLPQRTAEEKRAKVETIVRVVCALKGMTFPGSWSSTPYSICCEYEVTSGGAALPPNWTHWGLDINERRSLQKIPGVGIWWNSSESFVTEWTITEHNHNNDRAVVRVPVATLTPAHLERIRAVLRYNRNGAVGGAVSQRLQCTVPTCGRIHGSTQSWKNQWHRCRGCNRIFCDSCGSRLDRPGGGYFGRQATSERECPDGVCGGRTMLLSRADV